MQKLHNELVDKSGWYASWHSHPKHNATHWVTLAVVVLMISLIGVRVQYPGSLNPLKGFAQNHEFNIGDAVPPTVAITSPRDNSTIPSAGEVKIISTASHPAGIGSITLALDGKVFKVCSGGVNICSASVSSKNISFGSHTITATAVDKIFGGQSIANIQVLK